MKKGCFKIVQIWSKSNDFEGCYLEKDGVIIKTSSSVQELIDYVEKCNGVYNLV